MRITKGLFLVWLLLNAGTVNAALYEISYISNDYGKLGSFTIDDVDIVNNLGNNSLGGNYVLNDFIQDLSFSYNGMEWGKDDISLGSSTAHAYNISGEMPILYSANGSLARNSSNQAITMYHPSVGVRFGSEFVLGTWVTTPTAVPVPAAAWLFASALVGLGWFRRKAN